MDLDTIRSTDVLPYVPTSAIKINQLRTFDQEYFLAKHAIYARHLYICGKKKNIIIMDL